MNHKEYYLRPQIVSLLDCHGIEIIKNVIPVQSGSFDKVTTPEHGVQWNCAKAVSLN